MTEAEFACLLAAEGQRVVRSGAVWWRQVRPFFYRPVLPYVPLGNRTTLPVHAKIGGAQFAVTAPGDANSTMQVVMFDNACEYSLDTLPPKRRWEVRTALKQITVRPLSTPAELQVAHPAYVEFYRRTGYDYLSNRLDRRAFDRWCETVFRHRDVSVASYFDRSELCAVTICRLVGRTLHYSTFFARDAALSRHVPSLALHTVRMEAAATGADAVFVGMRKPSAYRSVDDFYLHRGATLQSVAARLEVNAAARLALRTFAPGVWRELNE